MATTSELLDVLVEQFKGWNRDGERGILRYLDVAHQILCNVETDERVIMDTSAGGLPGITTVDGTYEYTMPSNVGYVSKVGVESSLTSTVSGTALSTLTGLDYGTRRGTYTPIEYFKFGGIEYIRIPYIRTYQAGETAYAKVLFTVNPGDTTSLYKYVAFKKPVSLTSDSIQHEIVPPFDDLYLLPATVKLLEGIEHGNYMEARAVIVNQIVPAYAKAMRVGEQGMDEIPPDRGF